MSKENIDPLDTQRDNLKRRLANENGKELVKVMTKEKLDHAGSRAERTVIRLKGFFREKIGMGTFLNDRLGNRPGLGQKLFSKTYMDKIIERGDYASKIEKYLEQNTGVDFLSHLDSDAYKEMREKILQIDGEPIGGDKETPDIHRTPCIISQTDIETQQKEITKAVDAFEHDPTNAALKERSYAALSVLEGYIGHCSEKNIASQDPIVKKLVSALSPASTIFSIKTGLTIGVDVTINGNTFPKANFMRDLRLIVRAYDITEQDIMKLIGNTRVNHQRDVVTALTSNAYSTYSFHTEPNGEYALSNATQKMALHQTNSGELQYKDKTTGVLTSLLDATGTVVKDLFTLAEVSTIPSPRRGTEALAKKLLRDLGAPPDLSVVIDADQKVYFLRGGQHIELTKVGGALRYMTGTSTVPINTTFITGLGTLPPTSPLLRIPKAPIGSRIFYPQRAPDQLEQALHGKNLILQQSNIAARASVYKTALLTDTTTRDKSDEVNHAKQKVALNSATVATGALLTIAMPGIGLPLALAMGGVMGYRKHRLNLKEAENNPQKIVENILLLPIKYWESVKAAGRISVEQQIHLDNLLSIQSKKPSVDMVNKFIATYDERYTEDLKYIAMILAECNNKKVSVKHRIMTNSIANSIQSALHKKNGSNFAAAYESKQFSGTDINAADITRRGSVLDATANARPTAGGASTDKYDEQRAHVRREYSGLKNATKEVVGGMKWGGAGALTGYFNGAMLNTLWGGAKLAGNTLVTGYHGMTGTGHLLSNIGHGTANFGIQPMMGWAGGQISSLPAWVKVAGTVGGGVGAINITHAILADKAKTLGRLKKFGSFIKNTTVNTYKGIRS